MYEGLKINFRLWHIVGGIYEYKTLIRLPRKQKKALKKNLLQEIFTIDRNYLKECPKPKKMPIFSYKQDKNESIHKCKMWQLFGRNDTGSRQH